MTDQLTQLAMKYGTDKWGKHHYTPVYYELFSSKRNLIKKVLEIGVGEGPSLRMWQDFFPKCQIFGAEIDPQRLFTKDRIQVIPCDQSSLSDLENLIELIGSDIDIVVEDGSHIPQDQIFTCLTLMPKLKKEVIYIIEDVAEPTIVNQFSSYDCKVITVGKRYDDRLIVVRNYE